jgi:hypothetical protein
LFETLAIGLAGCLAPPAWIIASQNAFTDIPNLLRGQPGRGLKIFNSEFTDARACLLSPGKEPRPTLTRIESSNVCAASPECTLLDARRWNRAARRSEILVPFAQPPDRQFADALKNHLEAIRSALANWLPTAAGHRGAVRARTFGSRLARCHLGGSCHIGDLHLTSADGTL